MNDFQTQSFILTVHTDDNQNEIDWHAEIIHVLSGAEFAFSSGNEIKSFILPYLIELGIDNPSAWLENNLSIQIGNR